MKLLSHGNPGRLGATERKASLWLTEFVGFQDDTDLRYTHRAMGDHREERLPAEQTLSLKDHRSRSGFVYDLRPGYPYG